MYIIDRINRTRIFGMVHQEYPKIGIMKFKRLRLRLNTGMFSTFFVKTSKGSNLIIYIRKNWYEVFFHDRRMKINIFTQMIKKTQHQVG